MTIATGIWHRIWLLGAILCIAPSAVASPVPSHTHIIAASVEVVDLAKVQPRRSFAGPAGLSEMRNAPRQSHIMQSCPENRGGLCLLVLFE